MPASILTIDIGTSSCKAALFSEKGEEIAFAKMGYPLIFPQNGWVEQDPDMILQGVCQAVEMLAQEGRKLSEVCAVSFSAQVAAQCLVDETGNPLTKLMSWMDGRAKEEARLFSDCFSQAETERLTGVDMVVTPAYGIAKLRWLHDHKNAALQRAHKFVQIKDYIIYRLTGEWVSDFTSLKGLVHHETGRAVEEILAFTGAKAEILPRACRPYDIAGRLATALPGFSRLSAGIPVVVGWNDMNAAFLGMGALLPGCIGMDLTGTSEHLGCVCPCTQTKQEAYKGLNRVPFLNEREVFYGVTSSGGQAVEWYVKDFMGASNVSAYFDGCFGKPDALPAPQEDSPIFLPYLEGERNPWNNPDARGVFFGLKRSHRQADLAMAVLEGVCFALQAIYERFPVSPPQIIVSGGASANGIWNQMKADVMQVPFVRLANEEAGCIGAAILAMAALEPKRTLEETAKRLFRPACTYQPDLLRGRLYEQRYRRFLALYHTMEPLFRSRVEGGNTCMR